MNTLLKTQTVFSAKQAAKEVGKAPSTILRAIKNGKLSAGKDLDGNWEIDASELFRVYAPIPERTPKTDTNAPRIDTPSAHPEQSNDIKLLEQKIEFLNEKVEGVTEERNSWRKQAETFLLQNSNETRSNPPESNNLLPWVLPPIFVLAFAAVIIAAKSIY